MSFDPFKNFKPLNSKPATKTNPPVTRSDNFVESVKDIGSKGVRPARTAESLDVLGAKMLIEHEILDKPCCWIELSANPCKIAPVFPVACSADISRNLPRICPCGRDAELHQPAFIVEEC